MRHKTAPHRTTPTFCKTASRVTYWWRVTPAACIYGTLLSCRGGVVVVITTCRHASKWSLPLCLLACCVAVHLVLPLANRFGCENCSGRPGRPPSRACQFVRERSMAKCIPSIILWRVGMFQYTPRQSAFNSVQGVGTDINSLSSRGSTLPHFF